MCLEAVKRLKKYYENLCFDPNKGYLFKNLRDTLSITCPIGIGSLKNTWYHLVFGSYTDDDIEKFYILTIILILKEE